MNLSIPKYTKCFLKVGFVTTQRTIVSLYNYLDFDQHSV